MNRFFTPFSRLPLSWIAFGLGVLVFIFTRLLPGADWRLPTDEQALLDVAYIENLREGLGSYSLIGEDHRQTYGPHVLPQYARALLAGVAGGPDRAGIWLSLVGVFGVLSGVYALSRRILPVRGYCLIGMIALAGGGATHYAVDPDPSVALGMGLVVWGFAFFTSSLVRSMPKRALLAAALFGLAGYIRFELSLIQILLSLYLLGLSMAPASDARRGMPLGGMALGGVLVVAVVLWPLVHMNMIIAGSPILPGPDADVILGAPAAAGGTGLPFMSRFFSGFRLLMFDPTGSGIFAGLLWPVGMAISLVTGRHKAIPFFWLPLVVLTVLLLTWMSFVTGLESYRESLGIITPILLPFSILPIVYPVFVWFQRAPRNREAVLKVWLLTGLGVYLLLQAPHAVRALLHGAPGRYEAESGWLESYKDLEPDGLSAPVLSDAPTALLKAGANEVYGWGGETDWTIHTTKFANGEARVEALIGYLQKRSIQFVHVSNVDRLKSMEEIRRRVDSDTLPPEIRDREAESIVEIEPIKGKFPPPHSVYRVRYAETDGGS